MGEMELRLRLAGRINVYNTLAAIAACVVDRVPLDVQKAALESFGEPPGRFERVDAGQDFTVIVDYAHKPDGLMNVLRASRDISKGRVIVLFGCGGDRDRLKRPLMGRIAGELADLVIITSDNPRSEDPEAILDDIEVGLKEQPPREGYVREADREAAIRQAMESARPGDVVMLAGKGHETYQIFRDRTIHFDDKEAARRVLGEMRMSRPELFR
jgi:UDP-N-acetylmuramyl-tripeptide synthetase